MPNKIETISIQKYLKEFRAVKFEFDRRQFFTNEDIQFITAFEKKTFYQKISKLTAYLPFFLKSYKSLFRYIILLISKQRGQLPSKLVENNEIKVNIAKAMRPKKVFEIGTYIGTGAASFKFAMPQCEVYTLNPKKDSNSNNPISQKNIGAFYRRKNLKVRQLWGDSTKFDYSSISEIDVFYIDGNHDYEYVLNDLVNAIINSSKAIVVDDYVNTEEKNGTIYLPWNEGVVKAVNEVIQKFGYVFKACYHIKDSPYCVLIKK